MNVHITNLLTKNKVTLTDVEPICFIETKVPNVEKPIKAVVLDVIENYTSDHSACCMYILAICIFLLYVYFVCTEENL